jgi:TatD DNase family protein
MAVAQAAVELGFHLSFSGILTFRNAQDLRDVAQWVPLDRCLIETDSPYLAPVPHRGKTNQPAWVAEVAAQLARVKGLEVDEVARATSRNFEQLFGVSNQPHASQA